MQGDRIMTGSVYGSTAKRGGLVANIERYALNDGLGVRTTVFLKGCPMRMLQKYWNATWRCWASLC